jgi:hypothetical protein
MGEAPGAMAGGFKHSAYSEVNCREIAFAIAQLSLALVGANLYSMCVSVLVCGLNLAGAAKNGFRLCPWHCVDGSRHSTRAFYADWRGC